MDTALIVPLVSAGTAGVFCVLFVLGWIVPKGVVDDLKAENAALKASNAAERERGDAAIAAASASRDVLAAIQFGQRTGPPRDI